MYTILYLSYKLCLIADYEICLIQRHQNSEIQTVSPTKLFFSHILDIKNINSYANFGFHLILRLGEMPPPRNLKRYFRIQNIEISFKQALFYYQLCNKVLIKSFEHINSVS